MTLNRRQLLRRGVAFGGAVVCYAVSPGRILCGAAAAEIGFSASRRRTFQAVVAAVGAAHTSGVDASMSGTAADDFALWYAGQAPWTQRYVDATLDDIEQMGAGGFSDLSPAQALDLIRNATSTGRRARMPNGLQGDQYVSSGAAGIRAQMSKQPLVIDAKTGLPALSEARWPGSPSAPAGPVALTTSRVAASQAVAFAALPFFPDPLECHPCDVTVGV
jgi:hypothetical protein